MAQVLGLGNVKDCLTPMEASTYGAGWLIKNAMDTGYTKIILGLGSSAMTTGCRSRVSTGHKIFVE